MADVHDIERELTNLSNEAKSCLAGELNSRQAENIIARLRHLADRLCDDEQKKVAGHLRKAAELIGKQLTNGKA